MAITALPTPPSRADAANFASRGDAFLGALPTFQSEANALQTDVNAKQASTATSATAALASQNAAATAAANSSTSAGQAAASAVAAAAAAAAAGGSFPAQTATNGKVLRSALGVANWGSPFGPARQVRYTATTENELTMSSAAKRASWSHDANTSFVLQPVGGPNGFGYVAVVNGVTSATLFAQTPVQGVTKTISCWWRGVAKPALGNLIEGYYRDSGNIQQATLLPFSDASVIADGRWRRYSVTITHAGSNVASQAVYFCTNTGSATLDFADPCVNVGSVPGEYVCTGSEVILEPNNSYDFDLSAGSVIGYLPQAATDDWVSVKDAQRLAATNNIVLARLDASLIESASANLEIDINGASVHLVKNTTKGWLLK